MSDEFEDASYESKVRLMGSLSLLRRSAVTGEGVDVGRLRSEQQGAIEKFREQSRRNYEGSAGAGEPAAEAPDRVVGS